MRVIDCFPFYNEFDLLEIRLHEMSKAAQLFVIVEAGETIYGAAPKPYNLESQWDRYKAFHKRMLYCKVPALYPPLPGRIDVYTEHGPTQGEIRSAGRAREGNQRDQLLPFLRDHVGAQADDIIVFSDCDEIPRGATVDAAIPLVQRHGIHRLKQRSFYYNVNCLVDYGRDVCSRARMGTFAQLEAAGGPQAFRMYGGDNCPAIEDGGWHMSFFGKLDQIQHKVAINAPGLIEYKEFGPRQLAKDILTGKDLLHRHPNFSTLPETFRFVDDNDLPQYYLEHKEKFKHFTQAYLKAQVGK